MDLKMIINFCECDKNTHMDSRNRVREAKEGRRVRKNEEGDVNVNGPLEKRRATPTQQLPCKTEKVDCEKWA